MTVPQPGVNLSEEKVSLKSVIRNYLELIRRKDVQAVAFAYTLMFLSISVFIVYLPAWIESTFNVNGNVIASIFLVGGIANVISGPQAGKLSDKLGRKNIIITSCLGLFILLGCTPYLMVRFWVAYPLFFFVMVLIAMRISPFQALSSELVNADKRGTLMSLLISIGQIGNSIGGGIAGPLYESSGYTGNAFLSALTMLIMAYVVWRFVPEPDLKKRLEFNID
jgi:predicted MFS family arabinose efflux permease